MLRLIDIALSLLGIFLVSPLLLFCMIFLKFTGEGEVFYKQNRVGLNGKIFSLYKFATMMKNSADIGTGTITIKNDPRILPLGKLLRKSKINELPQLFNILKGEMSIIGPRPLTEETFGFYDKSAQFKIKQIKPGLSGVGSIVFSNEEDILQGKSASIEFYHQTISKYKASLEIWFVDNRGIFLYFALIILTILVVITKKNKLYSSGIQMTFVDFLIYNLTSKTHKKLI